MKLGHKLSMFNTKMSFEFISGPYRHIPSGVIALIVHKKRHDGRSLNQVI